MARILALSSQVARGHVGLSAIVPALQALDHEVIALPTVLLSNHPGHAHVAGERVSPDMLRKMLDALEKNGWLGEVDAVLTGYLPSVEHVMFASYALERVRSANPRAVFHCDPIIGDAPEGIYIAREAAEAIRDQLLPEADVVKLNHFELEWLTGGSWTASKLVHQPAPKLGLGMSLVTSVAEPSDAQILNIALLGDHRLTCSVDRRTDVPKGTGDLFSGLLLGYRLNGDDWPTAIGKTVALLDRVIASSIHHDALRCAAVFGRGIADVRPFPVSAHEHQIPGAG